MHASSDIAGSASGGDAWCRIRFDPLLNCSNERRGGRRRASSVSTELPVRDLSGRATCFRAFVTDIALSMIITNERNTEEE